MKQIRIWIFFAGITCYHSGFGQDSSVRALNLKQCVDLAIRNNLQVKQSEIQMQANGLQFKQAKDYILPTINASGSQGINYGRSINNFNNSYVNQQYNSGNYGVSASLNLFSGLSVQNGIRQAALYYDASKMDLQQFKDNITLDVILDYLMVLNNQDQLDIARRQADVDAKQVERLEIQNRAGAIAPATLYDLKGQYASDQVNVVNAVSNLENAKVALFGLLNVPYQKDATYETVALDANTLEYGIGSDSIFQSALQIIPNIKANDLRVRSYEKGIAAARGKLFPTLSFFGSVNSNYNSIATAGINGTDFTTPTGEFVNIGGSQYDVNTIAKQQQKIGFGDQFKNNRYEAIGLTLTVPILNYLSARNNIKSQKINLQYAKITANASRNQLQQQVEQAWQNMNQAYGQYKGFMDQVKAFEESFRTAEIRFNNGVITSVDYVIAKNHVDQANINLTASRYNYIFRTKILDYYQGKLTLGN
ncbi:MAG: TolC family protein [Bacteroidota bacterium]|nr:TolC family protein [Bacteroidota bacterium]MDP4211487.1 TolC family protein [Bacteroidota bacterium]MDP4249836.1 TolC family protein [Bacteroidota bacterium]